MRKHRFYLVLALCLVLLNGHALAASDLRIGITGSLNPTTYEPLFYNEKTEVKEWSAIVNAELKPASDLLVLGTLKYSRGMDLNANSLHAQGTVLLDVFSDTNLDIYVGLGYQYSTNTLKDVISYDADPIKEVKLTGQGFTGNIRTIFTLLDQLRLVATIDGSPWYTWNYSENTITQSNITPGSAYNYRLKLEYDINQLWSVQLGYAGSTTKIGKFNFITGEKPIPETKTSQEGITIGLAYYF